MERLKGFNIWHIGEEEPGSSLRPAFTVIASKETEEAGEMIRTRFEARTANMYNGYSAVGAAILDYPNHRAEYTVAGETVRIQISEEALTLE